MLIGILTFVLILSIVLGAYYAFVIRPERGEKSRLLGRLATPKLTNQVREAGGLERPADKLSSVRPIQALLSRAKALSSPIERLLNQSGLKITVGVLILAAGLFGCLGFLIAKSLTHYTLVALAAALLLACIPFLFVRWKRNRRFGKFEEQFPEAIELMARALRAGHTFPTGIQTVANEIAAPVGAEFKLLYDRHHFGMPFGDALKSLAERVPTLDARFFTTAVLTQRETGGNLSEILDNLAAVIRERFKVKRQVRAVTAHGRITGSILAGLPVVLALILSVVSPEHMQTMFTDPLGIKLIAIGCTMQVIGSLIIRKLINIRY